MQTPVTPSRFHLPSPVKGDLEQYPIVRDENQRYLVDVGHVGYSVWDARDRYERGYHASFSIELTLAGEGVMEINGQRTVTQKGDLVIMHPWDYCAYYTGPSGRWEKLYVSCIPEKMDQVTRLMGLEKLSTIHLPPAQFRAARQALEQVLECGRTRPRGYRETASLEVYRLLLIAANVGVQTPVARDVPRQVSSAMKYARRHRAEHITVADMARAAGCSLSYLSHLFRAQAGITAHAWVVRLKMDLARQLLKDNKLNIREVAESVGYEDQMHFSRVFKRTTGMPPREFRRRHGIR